MHILVMHTTQNQNYSNEQIPARFDWDNQEFFSKMELVDLRRIEEELKDICLGFDPYNKDENYKEYRVLIERYGLEKQVENPFLFTNRLLKMMDRIEQALKIQLQ